MLEAIYLLEDTRSKIGKIKNVADSSKGFIRIGEEFIKYCLEQCTDLNRDNIKICRDRYGKPYLDGNPDVHFNVSHSSNFYVFVCSPSPIGIDIEKSRTSFPAIGIQPFFSESEWLALNHRSERYFEFGELWCLKESYSKYLGLGLLLPFSSFSILKNSKNYSIDNGDQVYFQYFLYKSIFNIAVCSTSDIRREIIKIDSDNFNSYLSEQSFKIGKKVWF